LRNAHGLHARPAAQVASLATDFPAVIEVIIPGRAPASARSPLALAGLGTRGGDRVLVRATGEDAEAALDAVASLVGSGFGEEMVTPPPDAPPAGSRETASAALPVPRGQARGVSPGRVVGVVARMAEPPTSPDRTARIAPAARDAEVSRMQDAAHAVATELQGRAAQAHGEIAQILSTTAALATDPDTLGRATTEVREDGLSAPAAIWRAFGRSARTLQDAGGLTAERASDVLDVRSRILSELTGTPRPGLPERSAPFVLVARDLAPVDAAGVDPSLCLGILVAEGGPTSHTAILARALGIPAVVGSDRALELADGDRVLLDGESGEVIVDPTEDQANGAGTSPTLRHRSAPLSGEVAPRSGHPIAVLANVGRPGEVEAAQAAGAQGVGLFRTEFLFLDRTQAPSRAEQTEIYTRVLHTFEGSSVVVRTLDSGSDKPLPFLATTEEENPALGVRGLRLAFDDPGTLQDQLRAIADAARAVPATRVKVMAPMVATEQEAAWFAGLAREEGLAEVGVMVETPAAALCSREITSHLDFVSLGTNDLAQYTMAADRLSAPLAHLNDPWQPALLRLVKACVDGAGDTPVGVCGEAAADPYLAQVLVGIGVSSLSMGAAAVPMVGAALQASSEDRCREAARGALGASDAEEARRLALAVLN
jgi:phosphotransferase system enzyme I (PtsI)